MAGSRWRVLLLLVLVPGCTTGGGRSNGMAYDVNPFQIGTGEPVAVPSNQYGYADGVPQDLRAKK